MMKETSYEWLIPEARFEMEQRLPNDDPNSLWGFGLFLTFRWYF